MPEWLISVLESRPIEEIAADLKAAGQYAFQRPAAHHVNLGVELGKAQNRLHVLDHPRVVERARVGVLVVEVEHPLFGLGPPMIGPHRHQRAEHALLRHPQPANEHLGVAYPA